MTDNRTRICVTFALTGEVLRTDVFSDSAEERELALVALRRVLPAVELIESLLTDANKAREGGVR